MLVYFAVILSVLIGFCGLAVDVGRMELRTNQLQAAADTAALTGASELMRGNNTSTASTAAYTDVVQMQNMNGLPTITVSGQQGSSFGFYVNDNSVVEVHLTQNIQTIFLGVLTRGNSSVALSVKASAQMPPCVMFMGNPTLALTNTYDFWNASSSFHPPVGCPMYVNDGFQIDGFANIAGSQVRSSSPASSSRPDGWSTYAPVYNVPALPDPLAYITAPTAGTCINSAPITKTNQSTATNIVLVPGTYCGKTALYTGTGNCNVNPFPITPAIDIQGSQQTYNIGNGSGCPNQFVNNGGNCISTPTVTFSPGLYVIVGGINLNCVTAVGSGVTLYFTKSATVGFGRFAMISSTWNVNAPTDASLGGIPGISVMSDRAWTPSSIGSTQDFSWTYGTYYADGVIYLSKTGLFAYALGMSAPNYFNMVVANFYNYLAGVYPSNNYATLPAGNPLHLSPTLVQ